MASFNLGSTLPKTPVKIKTFNSQTTENIAGDKTIAKGLAAISRKILCLGFDFTNHSFYILNFFTKNFTKT